MTIAMNVPARVRHAVQHLRADFARQFWAAWQSTADKGHAAMKRDSAMCVAHEELAPGVVNGTVQVFSSTISRLIGEWCVAAEGTYRELVEIAVANGDIVRENPADWASNIVSAWVSDELTSPMKWHHRAQEEVLSA